MTDNSFFISEGVKPISSNKKADPRIIQSEIEKRPEGVSVYSLAKITSVSYPTCSRICKTLEFAELIKSKVLIGDNNRAVKLYFSIHANSLNERKEVKV